MFAVCCVGSGLCNGLITGTEESYRLCVCVCVCVCELEAANMRRSRPDLGCCVIKNNLEIRVQVYKRTGCSSIVYN